MLTVTREDNPNKKPIVVDLRKPEYSHNNNNSKKTNGKISIDATKSLYGKG